MDEPCKFTNLNTPAINLIKCLLVAASFTLVAPVFADDCPIKFGAGDFDSAFIVCSKAAEQGDATAQIFIGTMYQDGIGTPKDDKQAFYWYTKAAEQGNDSAQFFLGLMYSRGDGTPQDYKKAVYWYTKAAEQGDARSQHGLGLMYEMGKGTLKDSILAYAWYNVSASQGNESGTKGRGIIEKEMTPDQIAEAQKLSKELYSKYVK